MRHHAPEQDAERLRLDARHDGRARARKARDALKDAVEEAQRAAQKIRQHAEEGREQPAEARDGRALAHRQLLIAGTAVDAQREPHEHADADGDSKGRRTPLPAVERHEEGDAEDDGLRQDEAPEHVTDDIPVHPLTSFLSVSIPLQNQSPMASDRADASVEQHKEREELDTPDDHDESAEELHPVGRLRKAHDAEEICRRACARQAARRNAHRLHEADARE